MSVIKTIDDIANGNFMKNPLKSALGASTLGLSDSVFDAQKALEESRKNIPTVSKIDAPPTIDDAKKKINGELAPKTYGRTGTIKNTGGYRGLAASTLNLSSQTLTGS